MDPYQEKQYIDAKPLKILDFALESLAGHEFCSSISWGGVNSPYLWEEGDVFECWLAKMLDCRNCQCSTPTILFIYLFF